MARIGVVATAGAGGDLQPLVAAAFGLRDRGHELFFLGDGSVARFLEPFGVEVHVLPSELDLGPRLIGAIRSAMERTDGDFTAAGPLVRDDVSAWAREVARPVRDALERFRPDTGLTSLFGVEVLMEVQLGVPWVVINSTFYVGPNPPRPVEQDFAPRAVPLIKHLSSLLGVASLTLHASDPIFDLSFDALPSGHHYVGPLGTWEPPSAVPDYLDEPGDPWVLVSISSQVQDDIPLAQAAVRALANSPFRVVVTIGDHDLDELTKPTNVHVEHIVPHSALLERGKLLVSHAGHGAVMKALWYGRPMVLIPWGRDQPGVAARAEQLGVALVVPRDEAAPDILRDAISRALSDNTMRERAEGQSSRLRSTDPPAAAAEAIETLL